jgi:hypothetical protein
VQPADGRSHGIAWLVLLVDTMTMGCRFPCRKHVRVIETSTSFVSARHEARRLHPGALKTHQFGLKDLNVDYIVQN